MGANHSVIGRICNSSRSNGDNTIGTNNLPPITFHSTHGENIRLSNGRAVARRAESFCKGVAFSNRPVKINERVYLRFAEISTSWSGVIRLGFTSVDPATLRGALPKYVCPDFTNKQGYWAKALAERYAERDAVLFYYITQNGDVHYGVNGEEKGILLSGVDTRNPLWALLDIYGNTVAMEFLDYRTQLNNYSRPVVTNLDNEEERSNSLSNEQQLDQLRNSHDASRFHTTHGIHVQLSVDRTLAVRDASEYCQGYVFNQNPLRPQQRWTIQILDIEENYLGSLAFGLTNCNPSSISSSDLPDDSDALMDRPEYWVVYKDVADCPERGDKLGFSVSSEGEVLFYKNDASPSTLMHVDQTQELWPFVDLYGHTLKIKLLGLSRDHSAENVNVESSCFQGSQLQVLLPPLGDPNSKEAAAKRNSCYSDGVQDNVNNECAICCDRAVDSVLYTCGHMCMCYDCAKQLFDRAEGGQCPICRADIRDVIRTYRS